ncbi:MAG: coenzyme F420-0:L-glutamate ligase, partial [Anaerolineales bacterium]|nr:coenzyme F420-0:L-glutamate ligase [Anaerolineales bacterium]
MSLTLTPLQNIPIIRQGDNLADILVDALQSSNLQFANDDILVITQKIVSKAEGRMINLATITPNARTIELAKKADKDPRVVELMLQESNEVLRVRKGTIIVEHKLGFVCANAGIDHSNVVPPVEAMRAEEYVLLLPEDPDRSARIIREQIKQKTGMDIGVMIIDSHGRAWRNGTVGICIGLSGLPALIDE